VCDDNARNDSTSLSVKKAQLIWDGMDMIQKAETAESSNLMHTPTDYAEKKCPCSKKKYKVIEKGDDMDEEDVEKGGWEKSTNETEALHKKTQRPEQRKLNEKRKKTAPEGLKLQKGDEEDDEMSDEEAPQEMEKGQWEGGVAEVHSHDVRHHTRSHHGKPKRGEGAEGTFKERDTTTPDKPASKKEKERAPTSGVKYDKMEKAGDVSEDDADDEDQYDEEGDSSKKKVSPKDKEGNWAKDQPGGSNVMKKGEKEQEIDTETRGEDAKEDMDEDEDDEEQKAYSRAGRMATAHVDLKNKRLKPGQQDNDRVRHEVRADVNRKMAIKKGDTMEEKEEVSQEYVTKAMVPIEEVDTIIKARTEEISKAYTAQFDEIKKAYDAKIAELTTRVDKMSEETIRKGGNIVVIPQLLDPTNQGFGSNADALAKITAGK
jgi:hypothetical protein